MIGQNRVNKYIRYPAAYSIVEAECPSCHLRMSIKYPYLGELTPLCEECGDRLRVPSVDIASYYNACKKALDHACEKG